MIKKNSVRPAATKIIGVFEKAPLKHTIIDNTLTVKAIIEIKK
jgi:hypothetical protein